MKIMLIVALLLLAFGAISWFWGEIDYARNEGKMQKGFAVGLSLERKGPLSPEEEEQFNRAYQIYYGHAFWAACSGVCALLGAVGIVLFLIMAGVAEYRRNNQVP